MSEELICAWSIQAGWHTAPAPEPVVDKKRWDLIFEFGHLDYGQCISIENLRDGRYLAIVEHHHQNGSFTEVLIPDFPSVMEFLRLYGSLFQQARILEMLDQAHDLITDDEYGLLRERVWEKEESRRRPSPLPLPTSLQNNSPETPRE